MAENAGFFDFYSPFFSAVIITRDGERYPLWTNAGGSEDTAREGDDEAFSLAFLESISVELELGLISKITAQLTPPFEAARQLLNSEIIEWSSSVLQVQFGYVGGAPDGVVLSPVYEGVVLQPEIQIGVDCSITINAQGTGGFGPMRSQSGRPFNQPTTRENMIRAIVAGINREQQREIEVDFSAIEKLGTDSVAYDRMFKEKKTDAQGYVTDWSMIWRLTREARCTLLQIGSTLQFIPAEVWMGAEPKRTLRLYDYHGGRIGSNAEETDGIKRGVFPILSVSSPTMAVYMPAGVTGMLSRDYDSKTALEEAYKTEDSVLKIIRVGKGLAKRFVDQLHTLWDETTGEGAGYFSGDPTDPDVQKLAEAEYRDMSMGMGVQLSITTLLDPHLFPGDVVAVKGVSQKHDANYSVLKASYTIGGGGADMQLELVSNSSKLSEAANAAFDANLPAGGTNTLEAQEADAGTVEPSTQESASEQLTADDLTSQNRSSGILRS